MRKTYEKPACGNQREYTVKNPSTLLPFLLSILPDRSRTTVKSFLTHRQVSVNDRVSTRHDTPLRPGDRVNILSGRGFAPLSHPMLRIVFEDEHLIVIDKRQGLLSMGTDREKERTAYHILSCHVKRNDPGAMVFIVHRLDRETSGLMLFAKSEAVQETLQKNWKRIVRKRTYMAVVEGRMPGQEGCIEAPLRENSRFKVYVPSDGEGTAAVTRYRVVKQGPRYSLVELELETGRKNQIRAHMEHIGHPIAGDRKYGAPSSEAGRVCLHASSLCFEHPVTGRMLNFSTGTPRLFEALVGENGQKISISPKKH